MLTNDKKVRTNVRETVEEFMSNRYLCVKDCPKRGFRTSVFSLIETCPGRYRIRYETYTHYPLYRSVILSGDFTGDHYDGTGRQMVCQPYFFYGDVDRLSLCALFRVSENEPSRVGCAA